jgi:hypothetical protein
MIDSTDMRVPVWTGDAALAESADVVQPMPSAAGGHAPRHTIACACCPPRAPLAQALTKLFFARARGEIPFFSRVIVSSDPGQEAFVAAALAADPVTAARFRFAGRLRA